MAAAHGEFEVPDVEIRRHAEYWHGFVRFLTVAAIVIGLLLGAMALFLV
jgi:hypothetical protein